jgi:hypothetical protein
MASGGRCRRSHRLAEISLVRRAPAERLMRASQIIQGDEITPIRSRNSRFSTNGIRGSGVLFMSMR